MCYNPDSNEPMHSIAAFNDRTYALEVPGTWNRLLRSEIGVFNVCQKTDAPVRKCRAPFSLVLRNSC